MSTVETSGGGFHTDSAVFDHLKFRISLAWLGFLGREIECMGIPENKRYPMVKEEEEERAPKIDCVVSRFQPAAHGSWERIFRVCELVLFCAVVAVD